MNPSTAFGFTASRLLLRVAIRAYPRAWRAAHGEELAGVLLDVAAGAGRSGPGLVELAHVSAHGVMTRVTGWRDILPVGVRRRATTLAIASGAALSTVCFLFAEWGPWLRAGSGYGPQVGPFLTLAPVSYLAWAVTFIYALVLPAAARRCMAVTLALISLSPLLADLSGWTPAPRYLLALLAMLATVAILGPVSREPRDRLEVLGLGAFLTAAGVVTFGVRTGFDAEYLYRSEGTGRFPVLGDTVGLVVATLLVALVLSWVRGREWGGAVALNAIPWLVAPIPLVSLDRLMFTDRAGFVCLMAAVLGWVLHRSGVRLRVRSST